LQITGEGRELAGGARLPEMGRSRGRGQAWLTAGVRMSVAGAGARRWAAEGRGSAGAREREGRSGLEAAQPRGEFFLFFFFLFPISISYFYFFYLFFF
jgi:hypothetical protein